MCPGGRSNHLQRKGESGGSRGGIRGKVCQPFPSCCQRYPKMPIPLCFPIPFLWFRRLQELKCFFFFQVLWTTSSSRHRHARRSAAIWRCWPARSRSTPGRSTPTFLCEERLLLCSATYRQLKICSTVCHSTKSIKSSSIVTYETAGFGNSDLKSGHLLLQNSATSFFYHL